MLFGNKGLEIARLTNELRRVEGLHHELLQGNVAMFQHYSRENNQLVDKYNLLAQKYNAVLRQNITEEENYNLLVRKYNALLAQNKNDQEAHLAYKQDAEAMKDSLRHENETLKKKTRI